LDDDVWFEYNEAVVRNASREHRIVTHYDTYFADAEGELRRLLEFLEVDASERQVAAACTAIRTDLRHNSSSDLRTSTPPAAGLYVDLCRSAGHVFERTCGAAIEASAAEAVEVGLVLADARDAHRATLRRMHDLQRTAESRRRELLRAAARAADLEDHVRMVDQLRAELLAVGDERGALEREIGAIRASRSYRFARRLGGIKGST
jgi:hypothetical protein